MSRKPARGASRVSRVTLWAVLALAAAVASAQPAVYETEPNDTPAEATAVSGAAVLIGTMDDVDQDAYEWSVSDADALKHWTLELEGIPGRLTIVEILRVEYAENGVDVTARKRLFKMGSRDGSVPSLQEDLLFEPGEYILGVASSGGGGAYRPPVASLDFGDGRTADTGSDTDAGGYRLTIREGGKLVVEERATERSSRATAYRHRLGRASAAYLESLEAWYEIEVGEAAAQQQWDADVQVPVGRSVTATLRGHDGSKLASASTDARGKLSFRDLGLDPGTYTIDIAGNDSGFLRKLASSAVGRRVEGAEAEPNDSWALANRTDLTLAVTGRAGKASERDHFAFDLTEQLADRKLKLTLSAEPGSSFELCLLDAGGRHIQCRSGKDSVVLPDLVLEPGAWGFRVGRGAEGATYSVSLSEIGSIEADREAEPNDSAEWAATVPTNNRIKGRFAGNEEDFYRIVVAEEPQLWRFQVIGDSIHELAYHDSTGIQSLKIRASSGQRRVRLDNVFLLPGEHHVRVAGRRDGDYTLLALPVGPPDPNGEREPNDDITRMQPLRIGQTRTGLLADPADRDNYRFFLSDWERIRLTLEPPPDGTAQGHLYWDQVKFRELYPGDSGAIRFEGLLPPGSYRLELRASEPSEADYRLHLERLPRFDCPTDCEPNDNAAFAGRIPPSLLVEGSVGEARDYDFYALPVAEEPTALALAFETAVKPAVVELGSRSSILEWDADAQVHRAMLPPGKPMFLRLSGSGAYRAQLAFENGPQAVAVEKLPLRLSLQVEADEVAAYRAYGQSVAGLVILQNDGGSALDLELEAVTSHHAWRVELDRASATVPAGETVEVPLEIGVPADAWADRPVRISVRAGGPGGGQREAFVEISAGREARAHDPRREWSLPPELLGGFNLAWRALGGERRPDPSEVNEGSIPGVGDGFQTIFDGMVVRNEGLTLRGGTSAVEVTVELAGGRPVEVAGVALHPFGSRPAAQFPRDFEIQLSSDGTRFDTVLRERVAPLKKEQAFVLDRPVTARFARLVLKGNWEGSAGGIRSLGEWKVISRPGIDLSNGKGFNLADPELGGHVVWSRPQISGDWDRTSLTEKPDVSRIRLKHGQRLEWVVGFHHERAAQITRIEWAHPDEVSPAIQFPAVTVSIATESPVGPWHALGEWDLRGDSPVPFELEEPLWARYVRFSAPGPNQLEYRAPPETIRIWERPTAGRYRSVLGEWGEAGQDAIYEHLTPLFAEEELAVSSNGSRATAQLLPLGKAVRGRVALGREEDWYGVVVPAKHNTLSFRVGGEPTVRATVFLENEGGQPVPLRRVQSEPRSELLEAIVESGATYYARVEEPPRNVMFVWDTSASVGAYLPVIYNSLTTYAEGVVPGRDACNLLPFGSGKPLLRDWYGEPYILQTVLNDYPRGESSSDAEGTLATASRFLAGRPGTKAIVLVTDAATNRFAPVWEEFEDVRPRIFGLGLSSHGAFGRNPRREQDLMQTWSRVNGGYYSHLNDEGEMEIAFDRAATILRRPASYTLEATSAFREAPGPGTLRVVSGEGAGVAAGAVELILDASGSMLKRLEGKRRIEVAREVLTEAVTEHLPSGTPVALRVFGHKEAGSCRTDLEIPLGPLDPSAAARTIASVDAKNYSKTPIADSLAKVASDLKGAKGKKIVVLVTDGEETCDGDPEQVIEQLQSQGVDVRLNIVGFAIANGELAQQFQSWAELGGGRYFSAESQSELTAALDRALTMPFRVFDSAGTLVAEGQVGGDEVELDAGYYRIEVDTKPPTVFEQVEVPGEEDVLVELAQDRPADR